MKREVVRNERGEPFSKWKPARKFEFVLAKMDIFEHFEHCEPEYRFHPSRRWKLDFAWPYLKVAVEIDGFGYGHQSIVGLAVDHEKANAAVLLGWKLLRFSSRQLGSRQGVEDAVEMTVQLLTYVAEAERSILDSRVDDQV